MPQSLSSCAGREAVGCDACATLQCTMSGCILLLDNFCSCVCVTLSDARSIWATSTFVKKNKKKGLSGLLRIWNTQLILCR